MFELKGKYGTAKIFTDLTDNESVSQVMNLLNQPISEGQTVRMMPDMHAGSGCTVGTTMTITDKACPNLIGRDIGCGMYAVRLEEKEIDFALLDKTIRQYIPSGFAIHEKAVVQPNNIDELYCAKACNLDRDVRALGSLGGGNHFIEIDRDKDGCLWLVIHSGSRHLGGEVAVYYQNKAIEDIRPRYRGIPEALCWCEGDLYNHYVHDMDITQAFSVLNRCTMADIILTKMNLHPVEEFTTIHNYIDLDRMILRKGAVSAEKGMRLIIPINMRDGSLICIGKGNPDWNYSAPHGAGRLLSRSEAKELIDIDEYKDAMKGIWTSSVGTSTLDESPMAYKPIESIVDNIGDTVDVIDIIRPVYNFKASS